MKKNNVVSPADVTVLTLNGCLEKAITALVASEAGGDDGYSGCPGAGLLKKRHIALIDIEYIYTRRRDWHKIDRAIIRSDYYAFFSLSAMNFCRIPFLSMNGPVNKIKTDLHRFINDSRQKKHRLTGNNPLSSLNCSEKEMVFFLLSGYSIGEIFLSMGKSRKTLYQLRTSLMRKMKLSNKKDLHTMLKFCEFVEYVTLRESWRAAGENTPLIRNKALSLFSTPAEQ